MRSRAEVSSTSRTCIIGRPPRLSDAARSNATLLGECIGGALYISDFIRICHDVGTVRESPPEVSSRPIAVDNPELRALTG